MWERRWAWLAGVVSGAFGVVLSSCGGEAAHCPLPVPGTPQGTLQIQENHAFGRMYEVFEAKYFLDDCVFFQTSDTSLLRKPELSSPVRAVPAGKRKFRYAFKLRGDFESNMTGWEWYARGSGDIDVPPGGARRLIVWLREEGDGDPRQRLKITPNFE
jgi:hypothetical protein